MFFLKWVLRILRVWGVKDVRRLRFLDGSFSINSVRFCMFVRWRVLVLVIYRLSIGLIFWVFLGVMFSFLNLVGYKRLGFSLVVRLLVIVFFWVFCGRKKWFFRMVCLGGKLRKNSFILSFLLGWVFCLFV